MAWQESPPALVARFSEALPDDPRVLPRKMFGYPAAFVHGRLFASLYRSSVIFRLPENDARILMAEHDAAEFEPTPGRKMHGFVAVAQQPMLDADELRHWMQRALNHVATAPPSSKPSHHKKARQGSKAARR
jgi:hypothetical protein